MTHKSVRVAGNKIEVEPKKKMKEKIGRSPDLADSVALAVLGAIRRGFVIDNLKSPLEKKQTVRWKADLPERSREFWSHGELTETK